MTIETEEELTQAEYYMQACFELARFSLGRTSPNPVVGAIVLDKTGVPVGKGFHKAAGLDHAEVIAIKQAGENAKEGTLIVNLEPCCHHGKTPPCTDLIIKSGIKEVIFSNYDPNKEVYKKSELLLKQNNIKVISNVLNQEGKELNKFFFKWITQSFPYITLKQAQTLNAKIGLKDHGNIPITGEAARCEVHNLRNIHDAVLVGANTVNIDNPNLNVRDIKDGRNPVRIILDPQLITNPSANVYKDNASVILITGGSHKKDKSDAFIKHNEKLSILELPLDKNGQIDLKELFSMLSKKNILSVLVEAGPMLSSALIQDKLIDEYLLFISLKILNKNNALQNVNEMQTQEINFKLFNHKALGDDLMLSLRPV